MNEYYIAAIIGFWRQGASYMEIAYIMGTYVFLIEKIINDYNNKLEKAT